MSNSRSRFVFRSAWATIVLVLLTATPQAKAAIIIDDFDTPHLVSFPQGIQENSAVQVPGLLPVREIYPVLGFNFRQKNLIQGGIEVGSAHPGVLVGRVDSYPTLVGTEPSWANFNFRNVLPTGNVDLSEGGVNDTIFIDFQLLRSPIPLSYILVDLNTLDGSYALGYLGVATSETPVRLAFPASLFRVYRGGLPPNPETLLKRVGAIGFQINFDGAWDDPANANVAVEFQIDRIWVGSSIPEPGAVELTLVALGSAWLRRRR